MKVEAFTDPRVQKIFENTVGVATSFSNHTGLYHPNNQILRRHEPSMRADNFEWSWLKGVGDPISYARTTLTFQEVDLTTPTAVIFEVFAFAHEGYPNRGVAGGRLWAATLGLDESQTEKELFMVEIGTHLRKAWRTSEELAGNLPALIEKRVQRMGLLMAQLNQQGIRISRDSS